MTSFTQSADTIVLTNANLTTGMGLNSGLATIVLPVVQPSGASVGAPKYLGNTDNSGTLQWLAGSGGSGSGFSSTGFYIYAAAVTGQTVTVATMAPSLLGPITAKVTMVGGGGGGSCVNATPGVLTSTAGGGGGATAVQWFNGLTPSSSFTFTVGAGGAGATTTGSPNGVAGSPTLLTVGANVYGANGGSGAGGSLYIVPGAGGATGLPSGASSVADYYIPGQPGDGGFGDSVTFFTGAFGGSSAFGGQTPGLSTNSNTSQAGVSGTYGGAGGTGAIQASGDATPAHGGNGAPGLIIFELFGHS